MRQIFVLFALPLLFSSYGNAALFTSPSDKYSYPVQKINLRGIHEIRIVGVNGKLKMRGRGRATSLNLKVQHSKSSKYADWHLEVERRGATLFLEVFNVAYGKQWNSQIRKEAWPEFDIEIDGPAMPTTVAWREGQLQFLNWSAKLDVSFLKGQADILGGQGELNLQPVQADVVVTGRSGALRLKGESGKVQLQGNDGPLDVNWMSGAIQLNACRGNLRIESHRSDVSVQGGQGELNVQLTEGFAKIAAFRGIVTGKGERAAWTVSAIAPASVNVITTSGPVAIGWQGGGRVFLASKKGSVVIQHSDFIAVSAKDGARIAEGIKTAKVMGQVFVRTDSGGISWRQ